MALLERFSGPWIYTGVAVVPWRKIKVTFKGNYHQPGHGVMGVGVCSEHYRQVGETSRNFEARISLHSGEWMTWELQSRGGPIFREEDDRGTRDSHPGVSPPYSKRLQGAWCSLARLRDHCVAYHPSISLFVLSSKWPNCRWQLDRKLCWLKEEPQPAWHDFHLASRAISHLAC